MLLTSRVVRWLMVIQIIIFLQIAKGHPTQVTKLLGFPCDYLACSQTCWQSLSAEWDAGVVESFKSYGLSLVEAADSALPLIPITFKERAEEMQTKLYQTSWDDLPRIIKDWIKEHPYQTAFYVVNGIVFFAPSAASGPVLWSLGYTSMGPRAASFASLLQSKLGQVGARSSFAYLQSAGMGGYGAAVVNSGTRLLAISNTFIHRAWNPTGSGNQKSKHEESSSGSKAKCWT